MSDDEFVVFLAALKLKDGKYRLSANKIVAAAGGDRTHVLNLVRQVREAPPEFPPVDEERRQIGPAVVQ